jgi:hypothetical protein
VRPKSRRVCENATRTDRDRLSGAGAPPERSDRQPRAPAASATDTGADDRPEEGGDDISGMLAAIDDDGRRMLGAIEASIVTEFAVRIATARQQTPRQQLAAMLIALKLAQRAALHGAREQAKGEIHGRRAAVTRDRSRPKRAAGSRGLDRGPR